MPSAPPIARSSPRAKSLRAPVLVGLAALAAAGVLIAFFSSVLSDPDRVSVTVENPTVYELRVRVRPADGGNVLSLGTVSSESTRTFNGVIDQGEQWLVQFSYAGNVADELTVPRAEIESGPVIVPESAAAALREAGVEPSPP